MYSPRKRWLLFKMDLYYWWTDGPKRYLRCPECHKILYTLQLAHVPVPMSPMRVTCSDCGWVCTNKERKIL